MNRHGPTDEAVPDRPSRRVTSADVARASGVSRATVSYVLNDVPGHAIPEDTRRLVRDTAERLGHIPFAPARSLRLGTSNIVLALVRAHTIGYVADRALARLDAALAERGSVLMVHRYTEGERSLRELWGLVAPTVVVAMGGLRLDDRVMTGTSTRLISVQGHVPHALAGQRQVAYLHARSHTRLGYAYPQDESVALIAQERLTGAAQECARLGLPALAVEHIEPGEPDSTIAAIRAWVNRPTPITAVAAHNDELALLVVAGLRKLGLEPGRDMAVMGVDNIPLARMSLTTLEIVEDVFGAWIVDAVLAALDDRPIPDARGDFLRLIVRGTA